MDPVTAYTMSVGPDLPVPLYAPWIAVVMICMMSVLALNIIIAQLIMFGKRNWLWGFSFILMVALALVSIVLGYQALGDMVMRPAVVGGEPETLARIQSIIVLVCSFGTLQMWVAGKR